MRANQLRLWFFSLPYQTMRLKLLKIGARVRYSVRRISISFAGGYPYQDVFAAAAENLQGAYRLLL